PRRRPRRLRLPEGAPALARGRGGGGRAVPLRRAGRRACQPARAHRPPAPGPHARAALRRAGLVPPQGGGRHDPRGRPPPRRGTRPLPGGADVSPPDGTSSPAPRPADRAAGSTAAGGSDSAATTGAGAAGAPTSPAGTAPIAPPAPTASTRPTAAGRVDQDP